MTITTDLTTTIGQVRFELGDGVLASGVRPGGINFTDDEITAVLAAEVDVMPTVVRLMDVLAREWALKVDITLGPRKEAFSQISRRYEAMAAKLREDIGAGSAGSNIRFNRRDGYRTEWELAHGGPYRGEFG